MLKPEIVIDFWWDEVTPKNWFVKNPEIDESMNSRFECVLRKAVKNQLRPWEKTPEGMLGLILLLDQFSRNIFRDSPKSFENDDRARELASKAIELGFDKQVEKGRNFFYLPFMHSENLDDQERCIKLFEEMAKDDPEGKGGVEYAIKHRDIIKQFGRFPHRNKILGRASTEEEIEFLKQPGSSF